MIFGLLSEYCGANVVNIWRNLDKIPRCIQPVSGFIYEPRNRFLGSYMSPETGVEFQNESHVKFTVCDLLHVFINLLMLELVFCVYLYHCKPVDLMVVRYMFIPNQIP